MRDFLKKNISIIMIVLFLFLIFLFIDDIVGKSIVSNTSWNSYELQARAWLKGQSFLDHDYPYLELAIYQGKYFVSFPPIPSVILLPFVIIFPYEIPGNFVSFMIFALEFIVIYKMIKRYGNSELVSILLAAGFTVGTNLLSLSIDSGVWFIAQTLNNLLCILAVDAFLKRRKALVYLFLALAVGCRPFAAIYMVMFFIYYIVTDKNKNFFQRLIKNIYPVIPAMIVAIIYMTYNYIRFDNILEFGHNYLPEFVEAEHGQFSSYYFLNNIKALLFNGVKIDYRLRLHFSMPFCFFIANPVIIMYVYRSIKNVIKNKKINWFKILILLMLIIHIIAICMHKTLGAWQFGARYTCDLLPFVLLGFIYKKNGDGKIELDCFEISCIIFGIILNVYGAIIMFSM